MEIKQTVLILTGFSAGIVAAGGIAALIAGLRIIPRFAQFTHTAHRIKLYESCIIWGGAAGNIMFIYRLPFSVGRIGAGGLGLVSGIYVGAWVMALAEIMNTLPVFSRRMGMKRGFGWALLAMALGRTAGGLLQFYYGW